MPNVQAFRQAAQKIGYNPDEVDTFLSMAQSQNKPVSQVMAEHGQQSTLDALGKQGVNPGDLDAMKPSDFLAPSSPSGSSANNPLSSPESSASASLGAPPPLPSLGGSTVQKPTDLSTAPSQSSVLPTPAPITQKAGTSNPGLEVFSGGVARDTNYAAPMGTPMALPQGNWHVDRVYSSAPATGGPRDATNQGYGNMVHVINKDTGEGLLFEHLSDVGLQEGQDVQGGKVIGHTGASGNATGPNLGIEYTDKTGKLGNVEQSPYAGMIAGGQGQGVPPALPTSPSASVSAAVAPPLPIAPAASASAVTASPPPMPEMPKPSQTQDNASATSYSDVLQGVPKGQQDAATKALPGVVNALKEQGILTPQVLAYTMATIGAESSFDPTREEVMAHAGVNARNDQIANLQANYSGGSAYHGRGYVQLTHDYNYAKYGKELGLDLVNHPELASDPQNSPRILAAYMKDSGAADAAQAGDYVKARQLVQGSGATSPQFLPVTQAIANQARTYRHYLSR